MQRMPRMLECKEGRICQHIDGFKNSKEGKDCKDCKTDNDPKNGKKMQIMQ